MPRLPAIFGAGADGGIAGLPVAAGYGETRGAPHIRDSMSVRRAMNMVVLALIPCLLIGLYNTGFQANPAIAALGAAAPPGWRGAALDALGLGADPRDVLSVLVHGALFAVPVFVVALAAGRLWEAVFAALRRRPTGEGGLVVALLFTLSLPPSMPLWQVALGMSFAIVVGREIFGGVGRNFLNPALAGLAFLYAAYPGSMVGETAWAAPDAFTGATAVASLPPAALEAIAWVGSSWMQHFVGLAPGGIGNGSVVACLIGAAVLLRARVASARIMAGVLIGAVATGILFNVSGGDEGRFLALPWHWHLVLGSLAFGAVFLATDPVSAALTDTGRWIYGLLIGVLIIVVRVANTTHPDAVIFAVLLGNIFAPLIDHLVIRANIRRRRRRNG